MPATEGTWRFGKTNDAARRWAGPQLAIPAVLLLLAVALFVLARRVIGAFESPLPPARLVTTALVVAAWAWSSRALLTQEKSTGAAHCWTSRQWHPNRALARQLSLVPWTSSVSLIVFAFACSWPGTRWVDWLVWLPMIAADWYWQIAPARRSSPAAKQSAAAEVNDSLVPRDQILQHLTRVRTAEGHEAIRGTLTAEFAPGARVVALHVAFCPPFERLPRVGAEVSAGPEATVKIVQVLSSGARIDVQLPSAAERAECVRVDIEAAAERIGQ